MCENESSEMSSIRGPTGREEWQSATGAVSGRYRQIAWRPDTTRKNSRSRSQLRTRSFGIIPVGSDGLSVARRDDQVPHLRAHARADAARAGVAHGNEQACCFVTLGSAGEQTH